MKSQRGFSMIEVVITIAIMGILMAAAMPSVGDWLRNAKIRNTAESMVNGLQQARNAAVSGNRPTTFSLVNNLTSSCALSNTSGSWVVSATSPAGKCDVNSSLTNAPQTVAKGAVADGGGATVEATLVDGTTSATAVTFNGLGMVSQASLATAIRRIKVTSPDGTSYSRRVEISPGGVARLCDPGISAVGDSRKCTQ